MNSLNKLILLLLLTLASTSHAAQENFRVISADELNWGYLNPARGDKGPSAADLWGDRTKDMPTGILLRFPKGFSSPSHIHNISYRGVVIEGELHNDDPNAANMWLPTGSYWTQPAGEAHITSANDTQNIAFIEIDAGPYLVKPPQSAFDNSERPFNMHADNIVWSDIEPTGSVSNGGIKVNYLWGSLEEGQFRGALLKFPAGVSAALSSKASDTSRSQSPGNRLELAYWLTHREHPLTARVAVNRIWQQFFGRGLVESSENFGSQGTPPSHPDLLDYLAVELINRDWDLRAIEKLILTSSTYQQSSAVTAEMLQRDPKNELLTRGPRMRLPGFTLRDQALQLSGLLTNRVGGPSAKPYMPPKIWSAISNNKYTQDKGENLFRRSIYTYWRRTIPPPTMMNFNAAAREVCIVRTQRTNTPLQALTLMNNKLFVEAARGLAQRMILESKSDTAADQIAFGFQLACGREPTVSERQVLVRSHREFLKQFRQQPGQARKLLEIGESLRDATVPINTHAAMTMTASLLLNLDETITKE